MSQAGNKEVYRHWGSSKFDIELFDPIKNRYLSNKPFGGLWSSPTKDVDMSWERWSIVNEFRLDKLEEHFDFTIKDNARVLVIKDIKDLDKLPRLKDKNNFIVNTDSMNSNIDFEELTKNYDAIMVWIYRSDDQDGLVRTFDGIYYRLYGWDVDTLLVLNPDIVEEVPSV